MRRAVLSTLLALVAAMSIGACQGAPTAPEPPPGPEPEAPRLEVELSPVWRGALVGVLGRELARAPLARHAAAFRPLFAGVELTPYLSGAEADAARALFDASRHREARAAYDALATALSERDTAGARAARFMAAVSAFYADDWRDAATRFEDLIEAYPELVDTHRAMAAIARYQLREYERSLALADAVDPRSGNGSRAVLYAARALLRLSRPAEARERLTALMERSGEQPSAMLLLAQAWREEGMPEQAFAVYRALDEAFPRSWEADIARQRLEEEDARARVAPSDADGASSRAQRAGLADLRTGQRELERFRTERAVLHLERAARRLEPGSAPWCEACYTLSRALERQRDYGAASARYDEAAERCSETALNARILYYGARSHFRNDTHERALELIGTLRGAVAPDAAGTLLDEALLLEAHVHEARQDEPARRRVLEHILLERSDPQTLHEAAFQLVWQDYRAGDHAAALRTADRALTRLPREDRSYSRGRLPYWRARSLERLGRESEALAAYRALLAEFPMSWYAHLALSRLAEAEGVVAARAAFARSLREAWPQPAIGQRLPAQVGASPAFVSAVELARVGLSVSVRRELEALVDAPEPDELWLLIEVLQAMGEVTEAVEIARRQVPEFQDVPPAGAHVQRWRLAYPRPFAALSGSSAQRAGVDEALVLAIMREETSFNASAESPANAVGVMQLMLPTARGLVEAGESLPVDAQTLRDPALNIELGSRYLGRLATRFEGHPALMAAAYNAGGPRVRAWLEAVAPGQPLDEFVESIPYVETRRYTKRVVSSLGVYTFLRDGEPLLLQQALPPSSRAP